MAEAFTFIPASGSALNLHDGTNFRLLRLNGAGIAGVNHQSVRTPLQDGETYIRTLLEPRFLIADIALMGTSFTDLQTQRRELASKLNPKLGEGTLKWKPDSAGTEYGIKCYVNAGAGLSRQRSDGLEMASISFYCPDPAWYNTTANTPTVAIAAGGLTFPITFPITFVLPSTTETINNQGDLASAPVITADGYFEDPKFTNDTTGKSLNIQNQRIESGETLTVDMGAKTVEIDGTSILSKVTTDSEFWDLAKGNNDVTIRIQVGVATTFTVTYDTRYIGL